MGGIVRSIFGGDGGGQAPQQTTSTAYNTNIPEYARPYVETMLGATQRQLFNIDDSGNITGFKPYQPYSNKPEDYIAGFSPLQQKAQQDIANLKASPAYDIGTYGSLGVANQATPQGFQNQVGGYMNPYLRGVLDPALQEAQRQYAITGQQQQAAATNAGAFGGTREALMRAENDRNKNMAMNQIIGQGYNQAFNQAQQQYNQNLQNQLAGYGQAAGIAGQGLQAQQGIINAQNVVGAQQQGLQQQIINQQVQDYANAQQYPLMQLGTMSNMLRGLPMQAQTTNQYQAAPNQLSQAIGTAGAAASLYNATKAEGGVIKGYASGGITSIPRYDVGGSIKAKLEDMDIAGLQREIKESSSPSVKQMAQEILAMKQAPVRAAGGGIIAFAKPTEENNYSLVSDPMGTGASEIVRGKGSEGDDRTILEKIGLFNPENRRALEKSEKEIAEKEAAAALASTKTKTETKPTPPAAPAPENKGIRDVPQAVPPVNAANAAAPAGPSSSGILADPPEIAAMRKAAADYGVTASKSAAELAAEKEAYLKSQGLDAASAKAAERADRAAELANSKDEARRQNYMTMAKFFAGWGSTPGSTLQAGLANLQKTMPEFIDNRKEYKKFEREIKKAMRDIDESIRLEKIGNYEGASKIKQEAASNMMHIYGNLATYAAHKQSTQASLANAAATRAASAARSADSRDERQIASAQMAQRNITDLAKAHETERNHPAYTNAMNLVDMYKDKPLDKLPESIRGKVEASRNLVSAVNTRQATEMRDAKEIKDQLFDRTVLGRNKPKTDSNDPFGIR